MNHNFDDILSECLDRVAAGEDIRACIERYPEHAEELSSLLRIAKVTMRVAAEASVVDDAKARVLARVNRRLAQAIDAGGSSGPPSKWRWLRTRGFIPGLVASPMARPVMVGFAVVFLALVAAGTTTLASADSVPGEPLYWVKATREMVSLRLAMSDEGRAKAQARLAEVRGEELHVLLSRGRLFDAERVAVRMRYHLSLSADHVGLLVLEAPTQMTPRPVRVRRLPSAVDLRQILERDESAVKAQLTALLIDAPRTHQPRIRRIIYQTDYGYRILIQAIDDRNSAVTGPVSASVPFRPPAQ